MYRISNNRFLYAKLAKYRKARKEAKPLLV